MLPMWQVLLGLAIGGTLGTWSRYGLTLLITHFTSTHFAWGTLVVNLLGCFMFGVVATLVQERMLLSKEAGLFVLTGFMGAFTTFSTFAFDTHQYVFREGDFLRAAANIVASNLLGLAMLWLGWTTVRNLT